MKVKMTPLHGKFSASGKDTPHKYEKYNIQTTHSDGSRKMASMPFGMTSAQKPMGKRSVPAGSRTGKSTRPAVEHCDKSAAHEAKEKELE